MFCCLYSRKNRTRGSERSVFAAVECSKGIKNCWSCSILSDETSDVAMEEALPVRRARGPLVVRPEPEGVVPVE